MFVPSDLEITRQMAVAHTARIIGVMFDRFGVSFIMRFCRRIIGIVSSPQSFASVGDVLLQKSFDGEFGFSILLTSGVSEFKRSKASTGLAFINEQPRKSGGQNKSRDECEY
jgi:hypothetical protein